MKITDAQQENANFIELRRTRNGARTQIWRGWVNDHTVTMQWGIESGEFQETTERPGTKGKPGTKAFVGEYQSACELLVHNAAKKAQQGYVVASPLRGDIEPLFKAKVGKYTTNTEITWDGPLLSNLCFSKPVNSIAPDRLRAYERPTTSVDPAIIYTLKINGMMHVVSKDKHGHIYIQTRGKMNVVNDHYPHLIPQFDHLLIPQSIVLCEFYMQTGHKQEHFKLMQQIANSLPERARDLQKELGEVNAYLFRIPFWGGENIEETRSVRQNFYFIENLYNLPGPYAFGHCPNIEAVIKVGTSQPESDAVIKSIGCEGLVAYLADTTYKGQGHNFLGHPHRPGMCWKVKPVLEDDFLATFDPQGAPKHCSSKCQNAYPVASENCPICRKKMVPNGSYGTGKNKHRVGSLSLYQYDMDGNLRYICDVSSGLSDEGKEAIAQRYHQTGSEWVGCVCVEYRDRGYIRQDNDSNALLFPTFQALRFDKTSKECSNPSL